MNPVVKNILAVIAGLVAGSIVNMGLIKLGHSIVALPEGADVSDMEKLKESMDLFEPRHYIMPFLAHALGVLAGAYVAALIAASHKMTFAFVIGVLFLIGGIASSFMLPAPVWFIILDLVVAYIPMAWLGGRLARK